MPRRREVPKRRIIPDPKFGDIVVTKFMNSVMYEGKKSVAESIVYGALDAIDTEKALLAPERLQQELRELGRNLSVSRFAGLRGRGWNARWLQALAGPWPGGRVGAAAGRPGTGRGEERAVVSETNPSAQAREGIDVSEREIKGFAGGIDDKYRKCAQSRGK